MLQIAGRWAAVWKAIGEVLPLTIGPTAVLLSVGINVLRGACVAWPGLALPGL
eukprot:SAG22_NODE_12680_length_433_cov_0.913174_2_plen_52_part_01